MKAIKYVTAAALAGTTVWLVGCASAPRVVLVEPVGPAPTGVAQGMGDGSAHLEGDWNPPGQYSETELATLPCGRVIGWRAPEAGFASTQPSSEAN